MAGDLIAGDRHVMNAALIDLRKQLAEGNIADRRALARLLKQHDERDHQQADDGPEREVSEVCVHREACREPLGRAYPPQRSGRWLNLGPPYPLAKTAKG